MSQFSENRKLIFAKQLKAIMVNRKDENGKKLSQASLARILFVERETVSRWINGKNCPLNDSLIMSKLCDYFHVPPEYFTSIDYEEEGLTIIDKEMHKRLNEACETTAKQIGLESSFVRFLKSNPKYADIIIRYSSVDCILQSFSPSVPKLEENTYQFISSSGEKIYPSDDVLYMLRVIQRDVYDQINYLLHKYCKVFEVYNKKKQAISDKAKTNYTETIARRGCVIDINGVSGIEYPKPPLNVFFDMLRGRDDLSIDENHMLELYRSINEKGKDSIYEALIQERKKHPSKKLKAANDAIKKAHEKNISVPPLSEKEPEK